MAPTVAARGCASNSRTRSGELQIRAVGVVAQGRRTKLPHCDVIGRAANNRPDAERDESSQREAEPDQAANGHVEALEGLPHALLWLASDSAIDGLVSGVLGMFGMSLAHAYTRSTRLPAIIT